MAGPYYFASYVPKRRLVLRRNPNYGGTRPARFREIDIDLDVNAVRAWRRSKPGAPTTTARCPWSSVRKLEQSYGPHSAAARGRPPAVLQRPVRSRPLLRVQHQPPAVRVRRGCARRPPRRSTVARSPPACSSPLPAGAPGRPADQFIPPGLPGFHDASVDPLGGPDLARARRLAGSGRRHGTPLHVHPPAPASSRAGWRARTSPRSGSTSRSSRSRSASTSRRGVDRASPGTWPTATSSSTTRIPPTSSATCSTRRPSNPGVFDDRRPRRIRAATRLPDPAARLRRLRPARCRPGTSRGARAVRDRHDPPTPSPTGSAVRSTSRSTASRSARCASALAGYAAAGSGSTRARELRTRRAPARAGTPRRSACRPSRSPAATLARRAHRVDERLVEAATRSAPALPPTSAATSWAAPTLSLAAAAAPAAGRPWLRPCRARRRC